MSWITLITSLLPVVVQAIPSLTAEVKQIIIDIAGSLGAIATSGVVQGPSVSTILVALSGVIASLQSEPNLSPAVLQLMAALTRAAQAALVADAEAQTKVDPTTLHPITPIA